MPNVIFTSPVPKKTTASKSSTTIISLFFAVTGTAVLLWSTIEYISVIAHTPKSILIQNIPTPTPYYQNIAILGYGGGSHDGGSLTDSIVVAHIDDRSKKISLVSIPRDLWIELPVKKNGEKVGSKINAAYALGLDESWYPDKPSDYKRENGGGGNLAKYSLAQITGQKISNFVAVSFQAFSSLIDSLGGITITRPTAFTDSWYPIEGKEKETCDKSEDDLKAIEATLSGYLKEKEFPCRYETITFDVGTHTLDGQTALKYVRSRHSDSEGGDFYRSQRQRQVLLAIKEKALSIQGIPALVELSSKIFNYIDTDYDLRDIPTLVSTFMNKKDYVIETISLTDQNVLKNWTGPSGEYALIPQNGANDFYLVQEYLKDRYYGFSEASATARFDAIANPPTPSPTLPPSPK